jgi:hypothetical protein
MQLRAAADLGQALENQLEIGVSYLRMLLSPLLGLPAM